METELKWTFHHPGCSAFFLFFAEWKALFFHTSNKDLKNKPVLSPWEQSNKAFSYNSARAELSKLSSFLGKEMEGAKEVFIAAEAT